MSRLNQYTSAEEAEHAAQEALRDELLGVCTEGDEDAPCRRCLPCRTAIRDWDEAAEAHAEARAEAYAESRAM